jgi:hypothetical protein
LGKWKPQEENGEFAVGNGWHGRFPMGFSWEICWGSPWSSVEFTMMIGDIIGISCGDKRTWRIEYDGQAAWYGYWMLLDIKVY